MIFEFNGKIFHWRGPAPFLFVAVPEKQSRDIKAISREVTYGWGVIPVQVRIGKTEFKTPSSRKTVSILCRSRWWSKKRKTLARGIM